MYIMQRGIAAPILILLFGFIAVVIAVATGIPQNLFNNDKYAEVQGAASVQPVRSGFSVFVTSTGTWDLYEYLCEDEACLKELDAGKKYATVSGGATEEHEVVVSAGSDWGNYKYVKLYVRPAWGALTGYYDVSAIGDTGSVTEVGDDFVQALVVPVEKVSASFVESVAVFSD
jgi:hypothetical protein